MTHSAVANASRSRGARIARACDAASRSPSCIRRCVFSEAIYIVQYVLHPVFNRARSIEVARARARRHTVARERRRDALAP